MWWMSLLQTSETPLFKETTETVKTSKSPSRPRLCSLDRQTKAPRSDAKTYCCCDQPNARDRVTPTISLALPSLQQPVSGETEAGRASKVLSRKPPTL